METTNEIRKNGCGGISAERTFLENLVYDAIMELPRESWGRVLAKYFEKYGMEESA